MHPELSQAAYPGSENYYRLELEALCNLTHAKQQLAEQSRAEQTLTPSPAG